MKEQKFDAEFVKSIHNNESYNKLYNKAVISGTIKGCLVGIVIGGVLGSLVHIGLKNLGVEHETEAFKCFSLYVLPITTFTASVLAGAEIWKNLAENKFYIERERNLNDILSNKND